MSRCIISLMSGHSHFATIKRQKELKDKSKGKIFTKLGRSISMAVKEGGGGDPDSNYKLRIAIEAARASNMPKSNIERAIANASKEGNLEEIMYEGFGPAGVGFLVTAATDSRNRTAQEMKNIFDKSGGSLGSPGSVSFNFKSVGALFIFANENKEDLMLKVMDLPVLDIEENDDGIVVFTEPEKLFDIKKALEDSGIPVESGTIIKRPINFVPVTPVVGEKVERLVETLEDSDDVSEVFTNFKIQ